MSKTGKRDTDISEFFTAPADNVRRRPMSKLSADTGIYQSIRHKFGPPELFPNKNGFSVPAGIDSIVTVHESSTIEEVLRALAVSSYNAGVCALGGHTTPLIPLLIKDALLRADELAAATNGDRK